jgi:hypothetical protein
MHTRLQVWMLSLLYLPSPSSFTNACMDDLIGVQKFEPLQNKYQYVIPKSLGLIICSYKAAVTRWCGKNDSPDFWRLAPT